MLKRSTSRRDFLRKSAAGSLAMMSMPLFRALAQSRPDWLEAASAYSGQSIFGLAPASEWGRVNKTLAEEFAGLTGIDVAMDLTPGADPYWAKVQAEILGRSGNTHFVAVDSLIFGRYADGGAFENLDSYLSNSDFPDYQLEDYPDYILDLLAWRDGQVFGIPIGGEAQIMFYRQDLLAAAEVLPPTTWEEIYEAARAQD